VSTTVPSVEPGASVPRGRPALLRLGFDPIMALAVLGICACSLATLHTVPSEPVDFYADRQLIYMVVGLVAALVISRLDYSRLREAKYGLYGFLILSLVAVDFAGNVAKGAQRAIVLGPVSFQASELGKVVLAIVLAAFLTDRAREMGDRQTTARTLLLAAVPAAMVLVQPDLGSSLVYGALTLAILFVAGIPWRHFAALGALLAVAVTMVLVVAPLTGHEVLHGYQKERLTSFLEPSGDPASPGYQQNQSKVAIGSGEKTGRGDRSTQTQNGFLPEKQTDFIFAVLGERWGFTGAATLLSLYALLVWRALRTVTLAKNLFGTLLAGGIVAMLLFQVFVNVGMTLGVMPITGIPLPLMSYGGSAVITNLLAFGLLQSIYAQGRAATANKGRIALL
jgi:rod shape determining protein RodA